MRHRWRLRNGYQVNIEPYVRALGIEHYAVKWISVRYSRVPFLENPEAPGARIPQDFHRSVEAPMNPDTPSGAPQEGHAELRYWWFEVGNVRTGEVR